MFSLPGWKGDTLLKPRIFKKQQQITSTSLNFPNSLSSECCANLKKLSFNCKEDKALRRQANKLEIEKQMDPSKENYLDFKRTTVWWFTLDLYKNKKSPQITFSVMVISPQTENTQQNRNPNPAFSKC